MHEMVLAVRDEMQAAYPELKETAERVAKVVLAEELQFARVIGARSSILEKMMRSLPWDVEKSRMASGCMGSRCKLDELEINFPSMHPAWRLQRQGRH
jgi:hypothetical protein